MKCARQEHGDHCVPDHTGYKYEIVDDEVTCENNFRVCRRSLCECDKMFAKMQAQYAAEYDSNYSLYSGWEPQDSCIRGSPSIKTEL